MLNILEAIYIYTFQPSLNGRIEPGNEPTTKRVNTVKARKVGNSLVLTIPRWIASMSQLKAGEVIQMQAFADRVTIRRTTQRRK